MWNSSRVFIVCDSRVRDGPFCFWRVGVGEIRHKATTKFLHRKIRPELERIEIRNEVSCCFYTIANFLTAHFLWLPVQKRLYLKHIRFRAYWKSKWKIVGPAKPDLWQRNANSNIEVKVFTHYSRNKLTRKCKRLLRIVLGRFPSKAVKSGPIQRAYKESNRKNFSWE